MQYENHDSEEMVEDMDLPRWDCFECGHRACPICYDWPVYGEASLDCTWYDEDEDDWLEVYAEGQTLA
jgi:hypothetical protein